MPIRRLAFAALALLIGISSPAFGRDVTFFVAADLHYGQDQAASE